MEGLVAGDVVTVPFPFTDFSSQKVRPALVLAVLDRGDVLLCQITSQPLTHKNAIPIHESDFSRVDCRSKVSFYRIGWSLPVAASFAGWLATSRNQSSRKSAKLFAPWCVESSATPGKGRRLRRVVLFSLTRMADKGFPAGCDLSLSLAGSGGRILPWLRAGATFS